MRGLVAIVVISVLSIRAEARSDSLELGRKLFEDQEYQKAVPVLVRAADNKDSPKGDRVEAYVLLATAYSALQRESDVLETFVKLLRLDRNHRLKRGTPPKIRAVFARASKLVAAESGQLTLPQIGHTPAAEVRGSGAFKIEVFLTDANQRVRSVTLRYRVGREPFRSLLLEGAGPNRFVAQIVLPESVGVLEYSFIARDDKGVSVAALRDEESPFRVIVRGDVGGGTSAVSKKPLWKQWWFWSSLGVGVAAGTAALLLAGSSDVIVTLETGRVRIIVK